jgi:CHAT domain-containing protein
MIRICTILFFLIIFFSCQQAPQIVSLSPSERTHIYKILADSLGKAVEFRKIKGRSLALPLFERLLTTATQKLGNADSAVAEINGNVANQYYHLSKYREATDLYRKAITIWTMADEKRYGNSIATHQTYIGSALEMLGQVNEAILYYNKAAQYFVEQRDTIQLIYNYNSLGLAHFKNQTFPESIAYFQAGLELKPVKTDSSMLLHNLGRSYRENGGIDLPKSLGCFQQNLTYALNASETANGYVEMALTYLALKKLPEARVSVEKSLVLRQKHEPAQLPESYRILGDIETEQGQTEAALKAYQKALHALVPTFVETDFLKNPTIDLLNFERKVELVAVLSRKIGPLSILYQKTGKIHFLEAALSTSQCADAVIQHLRHEMLDEESKFFWNATALPLYEKGIRAADALFDLTQKDTFQITAFNFCRRTKAPVLADAVRENRVKDFAGVPAEVRQRERDLKTNIAAAQKEAVDKNDALTKQNLNEARRQLNDLQDTLHRQYARYYRLAYEIPPLSINDLKTHLADSTLAVEYFLGKNTIYTYAWTKNAGFKSFKSPRPVDFDDKFDNLLRSLRDQDLIQDKTDSSQYANRWFCANAFDFYTLLLKQPLDYFNKNQNINRLRIIPDGKLAYLPFDILTEKHLNNWHGRADIWQNYLIAHFAISYVYNDEEILPPSVKQPFSAHFGGFSVSYQEDKAAKNGSKPLINSTRDFSNAKKKLHPLPYAEKEVAAIAHLFKSKGHIWREAQKNDFLKNATQYGILHLSLHGYMDEKEPTFSALVFANKDSTDKDFFLTTSEIYGMQFNQTGLAILSACNTGNGKLEHGEGVMSMARAFEMAGCPSTIVSLWSIPDSSTAYIMQAFHIYQAQGIAKDVALQRAKLNYLKTNQTGQFDLPNYWAATVVIGDIAPVICGGTDYTFWGFMALLILGGTIFFMRRWRNRLDNAIKIVKNSIIKI